MVEQKMKHSKSSRPTVSSLLLASGNLGKLKELRALMPSHVAVHAPADMGVPEDLPEDGVTLRQNAIQKATMAFELCGLPSLADDSGLEVDALGGAPGVYSARFAGPEKNDKANMELLLQKLGDRKDRSARFRTVLAYVDANETRYFEGVVEGTIAMQGRGEGGFGYDPIFIPDGEQRSFAEMEAPEKNSMSHRAKAMQAFLQYLLNRS